MSDDYVRLVAGMPTGMQLPHDFTLRFMVDHVRSLMGCDPAIAQEYISILPQMQFALQIERSVEGLHQNFFRSFDDSLLEPLRNWWSKGLLPQAAAQIVAQIGKEPAVLIPACSNGRPQAHAMYLQILKEEGGEGAYTLRLFNASAFAPDSERKGFVDYHSRSESGKWQTVYEVRGAHLGPGANALNAETFTELLRYYTTDDAEGWGGIPSVYQWVERMGTPHNPPSRRGQGLQKVFNCTHKSIMAFLRNTLSDNAFNLLKATLLTDGAHQVARRGNNPFLAMAAERKAGLATSKWQGAVRGTKLRPLDITVPELKTNLPPLGYLGVAARAENSEPRAGRGQARMKEGAEVIEGNVFNARSAAYFPSRDGGYAYVVISDEQDVTERLRNKLEEPDDGTLLILKVPLTVRSKVLGKSTNYAFMQQRTEGSNRYCGAMQLKASASCPHSAGPGEILRGTFQGESGMSFETMRGTPFAGTFEAEYLDLQNRTLMRDDLESRWERSHL